MDEVKDKVKGFMKKVNNQLSSSSSSSSGKFKGQGRVLGSSSSGPANSILARASPNVDPKQNNTSVAPSSPKPRLQSPQSASNQESQAKSGKDSQKTSISDQRSTDGFDPFGSLITSGKRVGNGYSLDVFDCPVCGRSFRSEEEVSDHVESCISISANNSLIVNGLPDHGSNAEAREELASRVSAFLSGNPSVGSIEVVVKLLSNIVKEPDNAKFRRIRMSNPKIREAVGAAAGGVELLECVGFRLQEEGEDMWAVMEMPSEEQISSIKETISLLEPRKMEEDLPSAASTELDHPVEAKKVDRQIRVFFSVPESIAAKIDIPDSFYNLSAEELKRDAELRKKRIADSQLLIPKSYKEKQEKAARKRYKKTVIRIQFPDEVVLQGVFFPWEPTTALYEFVIKALKEPSLQFELLHRAMIKWSVIPRFASTKKRAPTLDEEGMVPSALVKFRPIETDSTVFTGLCNELLEIIEPLTMDTVIAPT